MRLSRLHGYVVAATLGGGLALASCGATKEDGGGSGGAKTCKPQAAACYLEGPEGPGSTCLAKRSNTDAPIWMFRVSQLTTVSPNALTQPFMQDEIITKKITLNDPQCNQFGLAEYNWLFEIDHGAKIAYSGGGIPQELIGPASDGTCYANFMSDGFHVTRTGGAVTIDGNDLTATIPRTIIPIYIDPSGNNYALLPVDDVTVHMKLSEDKNCVGRFMHETLDVATDGCRPAQLPSGELAKAWDDAGDFSGYITVEEADGVNISSLGYSLCVLLSGDLPKWKGTEGTCATSAAFATMGYPNGDACAGPDHTSCPADARDAWNLRGNFAASAIEITGDCP